MPVSAHWKGTLYCLFSLISSSSVKSFQISSMNIIKSDGMGGKGIVFEPKSNSYSKVLLWFHGLGDTADGWAGLMPSLALQDTKVILPTADSRPISINRGGSMPGWSDIFGLDISSKEDRAGFDQSAARVNRLITAEIEKGIAPNRIVVAGFSQGGALALHYALRSPHQLAGCIALSTWLPLSADFPQALSPTAASLPILQVHGDEDSVVAYEWGRRSHEKLKQLITHPAPQIFTIEGMGHSSDEEEMNHVKSFLKRVFA